MAVPNMAMDAAMLRLGTLSGDAFWRTYGWTEPAITFGYSQKWEWMRTITAPFAGACVRRMTGGGIVDHRNDLTYALTLPAEHPFHRQPALHLYHELHSRVCAALRKCEYDAELAPCPGQNGCEDNRTPSPGICFASPEPHDAIHPETGVKLAGAALKRNREGLLVQGSISLEHLPGLDIAQFTAAFGKALAGWLQLDRHTGPFTVPDDLLREELDRFGSESWNRRR